MVRILIASDETALVRRHVDTLEKTGHHVEQVASLREARERLSGQPCDIVIIDICTPDGGAGLLIEQSRAAWPGSAVLVLIGKIDLRRTKIYQMGLWTPDATLTRPFSGEELVATVTGMAARIRPAPTQDNKAPTASRGITS